MTLRFFSRRKAPQLQAVKSSERHTVVDAVTVDEDPVTAPKSDDPVDISVDDNGISTDAFADIEEDFGTLIDACGSHPAIEAALASMQTLKVFVTDEGVVYHVPDPSRDRTFEDLLGLVQKEVGRAIAKPITLMAYSKLRSQAIRTDHESVSHNDLVEMVLIDAISRKASDVYIAVHTDRSQIHFRTHGVRYLHSEISNKDGKEMARSLWSLAREGQWDESTPTDTSFGFSGFRVRANSMPDVRGNSVVLRLRDPKFIPALHDLGYNPIQQRQIEELQWSAGGLALISGETNSGKSTTLTSMMAGLPDTEMIIEIADPIEIEFDHVTHVQFDHYAKDAELRFRGLLASLVRQNPDTLFIGEVRDAQTSTAAIDMSLQGKRVWGTVHSHSCLTTISRLEHLGIEATVLAQPGFLNGVVNQSLVPIVCDTCCTDTLPDDVLTSRLQHKYQTDQLRFHNPNGCSKCIRGVSGQTVVAEVMVFPRDVKHPARELIREHDLAGLARCMREEGMISKAAHAVSKIRQGLLDPILAEEVIGRIGTRDALPDDMPLTTPTTPSTSRLSERS